jgi:hypothetical protein
MVRRRRDTNAPRERRAARPRHSTKPDSMETSALHADVASRASRGLITELLAADAHPRQ